jgi:hypothetical protein
MKPSSPKSAVAEQLQGELEEIPTVERAWVEGPPWRVFLICEPGGEGPPVEAAASAVLARVGIPAGEAEVLTSFLAKPEPRRRVRLVGGELQHPAIHRCSARVVLEWMDEHFVGEAGGEGGTAADLRACALAALEAVEKIVPSAPAFQLVGIKAVHVFDRDLLVVVLRSGAPSDTSLVGTSLMTGELAISVARAVLNALNRALGNYLAVGD